MMKRSHCSPENVNFNKVSSLLLIIQSYEAKSIKQKCKYKLVIVGYFFFFLYKLYLNL